MTVSVPRGSSALGVATQPRRRSTYRSTRSNGRGCRGYPERALSGRSASRQYSASIQRPYAASVVSRAAVDRRWRAKRPVNAARDRHTPVGWSVWRTRWCKNRTCVSPEVWIGGIISSSMRHSADPRQPTASIHRGTSDGPRGRGEARTAAWNAATDTPSGSTNCNRTTTRTRAWSSDPLDHSHLAYVLRCTGAARRITDVRAGRIPCRRAAWSTSPSLPSVRRHSRARCNVSLCEGPG